MKVHGYKVFNHDWTCSPNGNLKQYTCPGKFEEDVDVSVCHQGMHFCRKASDCFGYYSFNPQNKVAEVIAYGKISENGDKCCTDKLQIVREVPWSELLEIVNTGSGCTGCRNSGNRNSGDCNSGNWNSGDWNSGNWNSGDQNSGNWNSGNCNSGNRNSGNCNSGNRNSGNRNSGDCNSGNWNSGDCNSGNWNSGDWNSGNWNSGDQNSGDWNHCKYSNGCFNTESPKIFLFNQLSEWTFLDWVRSHARDILSKMPTVLQYVCLEEMFEEEKRAYPNAEVTGGYLKKLDGKSLQRKRQEWYDGLSEESKKEIKNLPNFGRDIFKKITGIDVG